MTDLLANVERPRGDRPERDVLPEHHAPEGPSLCLACGRHHGSVGAELWCLRAEVQRLRGGSVTR